MKVLALASGLFMALAPTLCAAQADMPIPVSKSGLIREIEDWQIFFKCNPKNAKKAGDSVSQLREFLGEAEQTKKDADIAPVINRFESWQNSVLAKLSDKDHASDGAGFNHYMKYLVASIGGQAKKEERQRRKLAAEAETAELNAAQVPERAFDGSGAVAAALPAIAVPIAATPVVIQAFTPKPPKPALLDAYAPEVQPLALDAKLIPQPVIVSARAESQSYSCENLGDLCVELRREGASSQIIRDVLSEAKASGANPILIFAVMKTESSFRVKAKSKTGALGLMQIMPDTGKQMGVHNSSRLFNIRTNIILGIRYLKSLWNDFCDISMSELNSVNPWVRDGVKKAIAAYNAGPGAVLKYGKVPPYRETRAYVAKVLRNFYELRRAAQAQ